MDVNTQLGHLVTLSEIEGVKRALRDGADANYHGGELLRNVQYHYYDISEPKEVLKILLDGGADPNYVVRGGEPILSYAATANLNGEMVEMLLKAGANPNVSYNEYQSVLHKMLDYKRMTRDKRYDRNIKLLCKVTNYDEVDRLKQQYSQYVYLIRCHPTHTKAEIAELVSPAMDGLNKTAEKHYGFETEFPNIEKNISEYAFRERKYASGRRKTKKRKSGKKKTKKRK